MNIMYTVCEFEADDELAALARYLNCPVLSFDSDFFIYNVQYIPFNKLQIKPVQIKDNDNKIHVIECKIYKVQYFTKHFGINEDLLPLLATLLGNDFVEKKMFSKFFSQMKLPKRKTQKNEQQRCIHGLINWLQNENLESAIAKIIGRVRINKKDKVFETIKKSVSGYNRKGCRSLKYFNLTNDLGDEELEIQMPLTGDDNDEHDSSDVTESSSDEEDMKEVDNIAELIESSKCPHWFADSIRNNYIPRIYLNLVAHHLFFCNPQAEDYTQEDSFICTLPILRYSFDMLTDFAEENFIYVSRATDGNYKRIYVDQSFSVPRPLEVSFCDLSKEQKHLYFIHFFKEKMMFDPSLLELLPSNFQIIALSILWWISKCDVTMAHLSSLLLCYTYLEAIDEKVGCVRGHFNFNNKYSAKLQELKKKPHEKIDDIDLQLNKNKVQYEDCLIAASVLLKYFELDDSIRKRPKSYDVRRMHIFAQYQCCLCQINSLNILCGRPYESTRYSKCYNGTFIYNVAMKLEYEGDPTIFCAKYLSGATSVIMFYKSLNTILNRMMEGMNLQVKEVTKEKRKRTRNKKKIEDDDLSFLVKGFESDVKI
ncbi:unnamed protein product [Leptidea sinapis]|uniref:Asteroid domain-containing protein n=1 Tax=Leptidea sinapis TaxID=189913 RepID=A0A5E4Q4J8_9NEOP|nr:unnamed protein product [Leptidea sinapis]